MFCLVCVYNVLNKKLKISVLPPRNTHTQALLLLPSCLELTPGFVVFQLLPTGTNRETKDATAKLLYHIINENKTKQAQSITQKSTSLRSKQSTNLDVDAARRHLGNLCQRYSAVLKPLHSSRPPRSPTTNTTCRNTISFACRHRGW